MTRLLCHFLPIETAVLVCELALSFLVIYLMLSMLGGRAPRRFS